MFRSLMIHPSLVHLQGSRSRPLRSPPSHLAHRLPGASPRQIRLSFTFQPTACHDLSSIFPISPFQGMTELNNSLCGLNWLLAKGGGTEQPCSSEIAPVVEVVPVVKKSSAEKPPYSYAQLIRMAIEGRPDKRYYFFYQITD